MSQFVSVEEAIEEIRRGRLVIVRDSLERENEADLVMAAEKLTPAHMNFMIKHGGGLICVALTRERAMKLGLPPMVTSDDNATPFGCDFTVSVDARKGITTGYLRRRPRGRCPLAGFAPDSIFRPHSSGPCVPCAGASGRRAGKGRAHRGGG